MGSGDLDGAGGGGGGWYGGGGGGGVVEAGGGGGGSGHARADATGVSLTAGVQSGDGQVTITAAKSSALFRLAGASRYETAIAGSQFTFADEDAGAVVLARGDGFADALPGGALATTVDGPMLLTAPTALRADTLAEIQRVLPGGGTVYLLGGKGALSAAVELALAGAGFDAVRVAGADRYATALAIGDRVQVELGESAKHLFVATGTDFPDGLAAATAASAYNYRGSTSPGVVLLSKGTVLTDPVMDYLQDAFIASYDSEIIAVGGPAVTAIDNLAGCDDDSDIYCITGANRFETALNLAKFEFPAGSGVTGFGVATGLNFPDALAGSAILGRASHPLLLSAATAMPSTSLSYIGNLRAAEDALTGLVLGGTGVVSTTTADVICGAAGVGATSCDISP